MNLMNKKGQGSFLGGDLPSIIMIVLSIAFFMSSVYMANAQFEESKGDLKLKAALVDTASTFLKQNAKIKPSDLTSGAEFLELQIKKIEVTYGVRTHVKIKSLDPNSPDCTSDCTDENNPDCCASGILPDNPTNLLTKRFPIALKSGTSDLEVYPALVKVSVYQS